MKIISEVSMKPFNTFGLDAIVSKYMVLQQEQELEDLQRSKVFGSEWVVLGGGSNILFTQDWDRLFIHNQIKGIRVLKEDDDHVWIEAGGGEVWHDFVIYCVAHNYAGIENLSLIPGTVGAAPIQNIGAYGVEVESVIDSVHFWNVINQTFEKLVGEACQFGYRDSIFKRDLKDKVIITKVIFKLNKKPVFHTHYGQIQDELERMSVGELSIKAISDAVIHIRSSKLPDPKEIGNAGSFFKNPEVTIRSYDALFSRFDGMPSYRISDEIVKIPAGWLIEQCGWKGYRKDNYGVHTRQALVLVNYGGAKGKEIYELSSQIIHSVNEKFGIRLEREVQVF